MSTVLFDEHIAPYYEGWFETPEGKRADRLEKALLERLLPLLEPPATLLEVGCGSGHFSRWLCERGWQVVGLDLSAPMLAEARARSDLPLVQGDALALPFPEASFEVVALITVLEFLPSAEKALAEAWRVARRGLLLGVLNRLSPVAWLRRLQGRFRPTVYSAARFYSPGELVRLVRRTAGRPLVLHWGTTLWPRWLPLEGSPFPGGAFIALAASTVPTFAHSTSVPGPVHAGPETSREAPRRLRNRSRSRFNRGRAARARARTICTWSSSRPVP